MTENLHVLSKAEEGKPEFQDLAEALEWELVGYCGRRRSAEGAGRTLAALGLLGRLQHALQRRLDQVKVEPPKVVKVEAVKKIEAAPKPKKHFNRSQFLRNFFKQRPSADWKAAAKALAEKGGGKVSRPLICQAKSAALKELAEAKEKRETARKAEEQARKAAVPELPAPPATEPTISAEKAQPAVNGSVNGLRLFGGLLD